MRFKYVCNFELCIKVILNRVRIKMWIDILIEKEYERDYKRFRNLEGW